MIRAQAVKENEWETQLQPLPVERCIFAPQKKRDALSPVSWIYKENGAAVTGGKRGRTGATEFFAGAQCENAFPD